MALPIKTTNDTRVAALLVAFVTMSFHSLKTARLNPVESLRYE